MPMHHLFAVRVTRAAFLTSAPLFFTSTTTATTANSAANSFTSSSSIQTRSFPIPARNPLHNAPTATATHPKRSSSSSSTPHPRRRLAVGRRIVPGHDVQPLKGDVTPQVIPASRAPCDVDLPLDESGRLLLKGLTLPELEWWVGEKLGEKPFRARQLWRWLYRSDKVAGTFDEMTDLSKAFRDKLSTVARIDALTPHTVHEASDGTRKMTYKLTDGNGIIESVLIPTEGDATGRTTLCVSSQWGCALNCQFCLTGRTGFKRSLSMAEIVDQVVLAKRFFEDVDGNGGENSDIGRINNVVFMGEGEPLHNVDNVIRAVNVMTHNEGMNMSHNKITVSTSGLVPEIRRFTTESKANLAVSLHATNDELRSWLMPINRKYPLNELMDVLKETFPRKFNNRQQKVFFQYVMLAGVNDSLQDAKDLLRLTADVPCKVNLIHFNTHDGSIFEASDTETILMFQDFLVKKGLTVTVRRSRGDEKMMACGQLGKVGNVIAPRLKVPQRYAHAVKPSGSERTVVSDVS